MQTEKRKRSTVKTVWDYASGCSQLQCTNDDLDLLAVDLETAAGNIDDAQADLQELRDNYVLMYRGPNPDRLQRHFQLLLAFEQFLNNINHG